MWDLAFGHQATQCKVSTWCVSVHGTYVQGALREQEVPGGTSRARRAARRSPVRSPRRGGDLKRGLGNGKGMIVAASALYQPLNQRESCSGGLGHAGRGEVPKTLGTLGLGSGTPIWLITADHAAGDVLGRRGPWHGHPKVIWAGTLRNWAGPEVEKVEHVQKRGERAVARPAGSNL